MRESLKIGRKQTKTGEKVNKRTWPTLRQAKGCEQIPATGPHFQSFLTQKPLDRLIPNPVATPPLPPQEKIREIRRFLWWVSSQQFPSSSSLAATTISNAKLYPMYGLTTQFPQNGYNAVPATVDNVSVELTRAQINQFYIRVITHAFKTWRHMIRIHETATEGLKNDAR